MSQSENLRYPRTMEGLGALYEDVLTLFTLLKGLVGFRLNEDELKRMGSLTNFVERHAKSVTEGVEVKGEDIGRTIGYGVRLIDALDNHFDAFIDGSFEFFNMKMLSVKKKWPELFDGSLGRMAELQEALRTAMAKDGASNEDVAEAYLAVHRFICELEAKANKFVEDARNRERRERNQKAATNILSMTRKGSAVLA